MDLTSNVTQTDVNCEAFISLLTFRQTRLTDAVITEHFINCACKSNYLNDAGVLSFKVLIRIWVSSVDVEYVVHELSLHQKHDGHTLAAKTSYPHNPATLNTLGLCLHTNTAWRAAATYTGHLLAV